MLTEAAIQAAIQRVKKGKKASETLTDPAPRGAGRLVLVVKPGRAEWYAQRWSDGRRKLQKLGAYPATTLAEARERHAGHRPTPGRNTLGELLDGYLSTLEGRPAHKQAKSVLTNAGQIIGRGRLARDIEPADIVAVVRPVHRRGRIHMAEKHRMYLHAAFQWGIESTFDYRTDSAKDWGLKYNPVSALPVDERAYAAGTRWLTADELLDVLMWASSGRQTRSKAVIALVLLTGQRIVDIMRLTTAHWLAAERVLHWPRTKNGKPHTIPVCEQAADILNGLKPDDRGRYFPANGDGEHLGHDAIGAALGRAGYRGVFQGRDMRRTWKTLTGAVGLTKIDRDRLQNHGQTDISAKHYDMWEYMPEKRAAVKRWQTWLNHEQRKYRAKREAQHIIQANEHGQRQQVV